MKRLLLGLVFLAACSGKNKCTDPHETHKARFDACKKACDEMKGCQPEEERSQAYSACTEGYAPGCDMMCHMDGFPSDSCDMLQKLCDGGDKAACDLMAEEKKELQ